MVCEVLGALPGTQLDPEGAHPPAWRVERELIVRREPRLRVPDEEAIRAAHGELVAIRVDRDEREALMLMDPETFFLTPHWQSSPSVLVWLARVEEGMLRELLVDAWRSRATKRLLREWEQ